MKLYLIIFLIIFLFFFTFYKINTRIERFQSIVDEFKIKIGVWKNPGIGLKGFDSQIRFLEILSKSFPIDIITYTNKYQPFYELKRRNLDLVFSTEKDYMIYHVNQEKIKEKKTIDLFRRDHEIQLITTLYHIYYLIIADSDRVIRVEDINNTMVEISPREHLGLDVERELFENFKVHITNRPESIESAFENLSSKSSVLLHLSNHPNKRLLKFSNKKEIVLLDAEKVNNNPDFYNKYLFLNKTQIDLKYYPRILQRISQNEINYKLNTYSTRTILLGLNLLNNKYIYEFLRKYYNLIDDIKSKYPYYNNFKDAEIAYSRLGLENRILSLHPGAVNFYKRIGFITNNSNPGCSLLKNECTEDQISQYGDYLL